MRTTRSPGRIIQSYRRPTGSSIRGCPTRSTDTAAAAGRGERDIAFVPFFTLTGARREQGAVTDHADAVSRVAQAHGVTEQQVRIAWTLHQGAHVLAIPGTGNPDHVAENVAAAAIRLGDDELAALG